MLTTIVGNLDPDEWRSRVALPEKDWLFRRLGELGADTAEVPLPRSADIRYLAGLVRQIREFRPSLIHAHMFLSGVYANLAALLSGRTPVVCTFHGRPDVSVDDRLLAVKRRILDRRLSRAVYVSYALRDDLEPLLGLPRDRGLVIHNGIEWPDPRPSGTERRDCGAGQGDVLVGALGNIRPAKDYPNLLRAAAVVCAARPNVRFAIVGDQRSPLTGPLRSLIEELGLADRVTLVGFRDDPASFVASFDLFVSGSRSEGLPLSVLEAMALGTPVVATSCGGVPEIVKPGETGALVPPRDPDALAHAILRALDDPGRTAEMAVAGAADVRARFGVGRMCDSYAALYDRLISLSVARTRQTSF